MKKMLMGFLLSISLLLPSLAFAGAPLDTVKANVTGVLDVLRDPKLKGEAGKKVKEQRIEAAADKLFDWVELSKRTLGLNWNNFTPDQRKEFVQLRRDRITFATIITIGHRSPEARYMTSCISASP